MTEAIHRSRRILLFVVTEDWYFVSHRLPLARAARSAGYQVVIATRFSEHREALASEGFEVVPIRLRRRGASPWQEWASILELRRLYRAHAPLIVHHVALKPVVFGSLAATGLRGIASVNAIAGLGFLFSSRRLSARLLRPVVSQALRVILRRGRSAVIVQNESDRAVLLGRGLARPDQVQLIRGAGVDLSAFAPRPEPAGTPIVVFAGRLLWDKGVGEFVAAARLLRARSVAARFALVGEPDLDNPAAVPAGSLAQWQREGVVEVWGKRADMPAVLASAHVVCLPSHYGEGVPKILLEAAASGRPVVTTDWPGCRDTIEPGVTGLLVPPRDPTSLAAALERLVNDAALRSAYGAAARRLAEREFDVRAVADTTLKLYDRLWTSLSA